MKGVGIFGQKASTDRERGRKSNDRLIRAQRRPERVGAAWWPMLLDGPGVRVWGKDG